MRTRVMLMLAAALTLAATTAPAAADTTSRPLVGMTAEAMAPPWRVPGDDGRDHLAYQLQVTNLMTVPAVLTAVSVRDQDGRQLQALAGQDLAVRTQALAMGVPISDVPPSGSAIVTMDVPVAPATTVSMLRTSVGYAASRPRPARGGDRLGQQQPVRGPDDAACRGSDDQGRSPPFERGLRHRLHPVRRGDLPFG